MLTHLFFDLDGTLTNSRLGIVRSFQNGLRRVGMPVRHTEGYYDFVIGPPLAHSYLALGVNAGDVETAIAGYREYYTERGMWENCVYEGVPEALSALKGVGRRLFVVTSKPKIYADRILSHFALDGYFDGVFGPSLGNAEIPKAELLSEAIRAAGITPSASLAMLGDRRYDMEAALAVGIRAVGVLWGFGSHEELSHAGARILLKNPEEITTID